MEGPGAVALAAWLAVASIAGAVLAVHDKGRARRGGRRIPEAALLLVALLGGWPGGLAAFLAVRHKTRKPAFLLPFLLCAVANGLAVAWLLGWRP